jgi:hypothetical protein
MDHFAKISDLECECIGRCRVGDFKFTKDGIPIVANHHPHCIKYNDSLIDVWVVSCGKSHYYDTNEESARSLLEDDPELTIEKTKIHKEIYEALPEFDGF